MPRNLRSSKLEARSNRLKLPIAKKPVFLRIGAGIWIGYRRKLTAGTWVLKVGNGKGGHWTKRIADADDYQDSDGTSVLDFWQAQTRARALAAGKDETSAAPITVSHAIDQYADELKERDGDKANAGRIRAHLPPKLAGMMVASLAANDFKAWRKGLEGLTPATINRINICLKAALNRAADHDERITNRRAWAIGLKAIRNATETRNVILSKAVIREIVASAYANVGKEFGLLIELAAATGARISQLARLTVADVQATSKPRLMVPVSGKGKGEKKIRHRPVPISPALAARLPIKDRPSDAPLLTKPGGDCWRKSDHSRLFDRAMEHVKGAPANATANALRHSSIVRQLLGNVPTRVVATNHDTSVQMIERTYSEHIGDHADRLSRKVLVDFAPRKPAPAAKVARLERVA